MRKNKGKHIKPAMTIQFKMTAMSLAVMFILLLVNMYIYTNISNVISDVNKVYEKNFTLNMMQDNLKNIQGSMTEYLRTKSTEGAENYYRYVQEYQDNLSELNTDVVNDNRQLAEKKIYSISEEYLQLADMCLEYKRGRNVERYSETYDETQKLYGYLADCIESLNNDLFRTNSSNYQDILALLKYTQNLSMGLLLIATIAMTAIIAYVTRRMTKPLTRLAMAAGDVAAGKLDTPPIEVAAEDEIGVVTKAFNTMLSSIREYIERIKENMEHERTLKEKELLMETHLKEAQLNYLQSQISPHFLFNTLNAGAQLAMLESADRTYEYIQNVADFYRYKVDTSKMVTLEEELSIVDNYMYIINVRFSGDIQYHKEVDETLTSVLVPSMILQPIVENAVRYGVRDIDWEKHIDISVYLDDDNICISVRDNGIGINKETIDKIFSGSKEEVSKADSESTGVGLKNVISRMRIFFETQDVMIITSEGKNMGTEVALLIPYLQ